MQKTIILLGAVLVSLTTANHHKHDHTSTKAVFKNVNPHSQHEDAYHIHYDGQNLENGPATASIRFIEGFLEGWL